MSDGVVIGVDSATTIGDPSSPAKIYDDVPKLFPLGSLAIGIATFGVASFADRSIGSWISELVGVIESDDSCKGRTMAEMAEFVREFFWKAYSGHLATTFDARGIGVSNIDRDPLPEGTPVLGLVLGGFGSGSFCSEVWSIMLPNHRAAGSSIQILAQKHFGAAWFAADGPIVRYVHGIEHETVERLAEYVDEIREPMTQEERSHFWELALSAKYDVVFNGMPISKAIKFVRFLIDLVINHHVFTMGSPIVGGRCKVGYVTHERLGFKMIEEWRKS